MANWDKLSSRGNVEDRRSFAPAAVGGLSLTGLAVALLVSYLTGTNPIDVISQINTVPVENRQVVEDPQFQGADSYEVFASTVLGSNNDYWTATFRQNNRTYTPPKLVLFRTATQSSCGSATSEVGPHYCPVDQTIYLDETFFDELKTRFGAEGGDVAEAYVLAHEVGHHAQNELGFMQQVQSTQQRSPDRANQLSVQLELQADCFAGLWANSIRDQGIFEAGEIREAMDAAASVGDDRIQQKVTGYINPESWTHGSADQRVAAFNAGYQSGTLSTCNLPSN